MKTRELSLGESKPFWSLEKSGNHQCHCTSIGDSLYNNSECPEKEIKCCILSNRHQTGRPRKTTAVDDRNIVRAVKKNPKTSVSDITNNLHRAGVKVSQSTVQRRLREQQYRGYTTRCKPLISSKNRKVRLQFAKKYRNEAQKFWNKVYGLMRQRLTTIKVMERPKCGERRDFLMIQNIQAHLWSTMEEVSWLGLTWLFLEWTTNLYWWCNSWW